MVNKDRLILIIGASGSGKTSISKKLEEKGYNVIHSYTTRPPREPNEWGHIFITKDDYTENYSSLDIMGINENYYYNIPMIAYFENYNAIYFATKEQYQGKGASIYVIDPSGAKQVQESVRDAEIISIFLQADLESRFQRMLGSRGSVDTADRLKRDEEIFKIVKCDYVVDANQNLDSVVENIMEIIS